MDQIRVRFAPSPTGHLHIGSARTALFNWLFARRYEGTFLLRIEDTDQTRSREEFLSQILEDLKWLGLDWDEGPYFQSRRLSIYQEHALKLLQEEKGYYCYCTPEEVEQIRLAQMKAGRPSGYDGRCRGLTKEQKSQFEQEGRRKVIRLRVPPGTARVQDLIRGEVVFENSQMDDFVIVKSDGYPVYNFACVIDDHLMEISHVLRGEEHLSNTPRQLLLYEALGFPPPAFGHLSLILDESRKKLSKREGATFLNEYRTAGFVPQALMNFLALIGWAPSTDQEIFDKDELIRSFSAEGLTKHPAIFDFRKLEWMNGFYLRKEGREELARQAVPFLQRAGLLLEDPFEEPPPPSSPTRGEPTRGEPTRGEPTRGEPTRGEEAGQGQIQSPAPGAAAPATSPGGRTREWLLALVSLFQERVKTFRELVEDSSYFFLDDFPYDHEGVETILRKETALPLLREMIPLLEETRFDSQSLEEAVRDFAESKGVKAAQLIHSLRMAATGRRATPGLFQVLALLGKEQTIRRMRKTLKLFEGGGGGQPSPEAVEQSGSHPADASEVGRLSGERAERGS